MQKKTSQSLLDFFIHLTQYISKEVKFISLRHKPMLEAFAFEGDYDYLVNPLDVQKVLALVFQEASSFCVDFSIKQLKYGKYVITFYDNKSDKNIVLEMWSYLEVKHSGYFKYIFFEDIEPFLVQENGIYTLDKEIEALYYLSHLKTKRKDLTLSLIQLRLQHYYDVLQASQSEYVSFFESLLQNPSSADDILKQANQVLVEKNIIRKKLFIKENLHFYTFRLKLLHFRVETKMLQKCKTIPFLGPDGVGKTTIIESIAKRTNFKYFRFKKMFRHSILYKIVTLLNKSQCHSLEKNQCDDRLGASLVKIACLRYPFLELGMLLRQRTILSDRFFHDLFLQDLRFEEKKASLRSGWKKLLFWMPKHYALVHLDAPSEVIHTRKQELSKENIDIYRDAIFKLYQHKPARVYLYLNTTNTLENSTDIFLNVFYPKAKTQKKIQLSDENIISRGNERVCYQHPLYKDRVIKVTYKKARGQNKLEFAYYAYLQKKGIDFSQIAKCYGWSDTQEGKGLVFEKIMYNTSTLTLADAVKTKAVDLTQLDTMVEELYKYLVKNQILFVDIGLDNIMLTQDKLVIIDGLGGRRLNWKFYLYIHMPLYTQYKIKKQWKKVLHQYKKLKDNPIS